MELDDFYREVHALVDDARNQAERGARIAIGPALVVEIETTEDADGHVGISTWRAVWCPLSVDEKCQSAWQGSDFERRPEGLTRALHNPHAAIPLSSCYAASNRSRKTLDG